jgi:hypothetical protein
VDAASGVATGRTYVPEGLGPRITMSEVATSAGAQPLAKRSRRQSLHCIKLPFGYSNLHDPRSVKASFRQVAFDGALSTDG